MAVRALLPGGIMTQIFTVYTDGYMLPDVVRDLGACPLYLAVAFWGQRCHNVLTTELVSREFRITQQRARDALHYIRHEACGRIDYENVTMSVPGLRRSSVYKGLRILKVSDAPAGERRMPAKLPQNSSIARPLSAKNKKHTPLNQLRQWMAIRRLGETVPESLLGEY